MELLLSTLENLKRTLLWLRLAASWPLGVHPKHMTTGKTLRCILNLERTLDNGSSIDWHKWMSQASPLGKDIDALPTQERKSLRILEILLIMVRFSFVLKFSRVSRSWTFLKRPLFQRNPFSDPDQHPQRAARQASRDRHGCCVM